MWASLAPWLLQAPRSQLRAPSGAPRSDGSECLGQKGVTTFVVTACRLLASISFLFLFGLFVVSAAHVGLIYFDFWPFNSRFIWPKLCANIFPVPGSLTRGLNVPNDWKDFWFLLADYSMGVVRVQLNRPFRGALHSADVQLSCQRPICCSPQIKNQANE